MFRFLKKTLVIILFSLIGWSFTTAFFYTGINYLPFDTVLLLHAVFSTVMFFVLSIIYFKYLFYTSPLFTSISFLIVIILMDIFITSNTIEKDYAIFRNLLRTWIPYILIFDFVYLTGFYFRKKYSNLP